MKRLDHETIMTRECIICNSTFLIFTYSQQCSSVQYTLAMRPTLCHGVVSLMKRNKTNKQINLKHCNVQQNYIQFITPIKILYSFIFMCSYPYTKHPYICTLRCRQESTQGCQDPVCPREKKCFLLLTRVKFYRGHYMKHKMHQAMCRYKGVPARKELIWRFT